MRSLRSSFVLCLFGYFLSLFWIISAAGDLTPQLTINLQSGATVNISRTADSKCLVCTKKACQSSVTLSPGVVVSVNFTCTQPEDIFVVEIVRNIVCNSTCSENIVPEDYLSLQNFNRTYTWNINVPNNIAFYLDFTNAGLRQILPTESCQNNHIYTVNTGTASVGTFCRHGPIRGMYVRCEGSMSFEVPGKVQLDRTTFGVSVAWEITPLVIINVTLPEGQLSQDFLSVNYPNSFPDLDTMMWSILIPPQYYATVQILKYTEPKCRRVDVKLEYQMNGRTTVKKLSEAQPSDRQGNFTLSLQNCKMNESPSSRLYVQFRISLTRRNTDVKCIVDLRKEEGMVMHIKKKNPGTACVMKVSSVVNETLTLYYGTTYTVSFLDCPEQDLLITINKTIACQNQINCQVSLIPLKVPVVAACLPGVLQQVTWHLNAPPKGAVELTGSLQQSLPNQDCNGSVVLTVLEKARQDITVGEFCPMGPINQVQIHVPNVTVTASLEDGRDLKQIASTLPKVSFIKTMNEGYIFSVMPKKDSPMLVATPAWPGGMKPHSTVSWIVSVSSALEAHVEFSEVSQLTCQNSQSLIVVQKQGSRVMMYKWTNKEKPKTVVVQENFYLNMSNCLPQKGQFSVVSQITLQPRKSILVTILSVVIVLLLLLVIILIVVCVYIRKKKKKKAPNVSVYNPNGHAFLPGQHGVPQTREDEDVHIYHCIDDTLVYGHLLKDGVEMDQLGELTVGVYQAFTGPVERQPLQGNEEREELAVGVYRPFLESQIAPALPDRSSGQGQNQNSKDLQVTDNGISRDSFVKDQNNKTENLEKAPRAKPEEEDSEIQL